MKKILILLLTVFIINYIHGQGKNHSQWWLYNYGDYTKPNELQDSRIHWAYWVFMRLKAVADKTGGRIPRLYIINSSGAGRPRAMAVPDGGIIIDDAVLDLCYNGTPKLDGDSRLAFILGHELAHAANREFLKQEAFFDLLKHEGKNINNQLRYYFEDPKDDKVKQRDHKKKELLADRQGVVYAAMAGYKVSRLFDASNDFLHRWSDRIGQQYYTLDTNGHPAMQKRVQFVRLQLATLIRRIELFRVGVLLFQKGGYHDGIAAFREFAKYYPARGVLNNIGMCYLHQALDLIKKDYPTVYSRFRLSTEIVYKGTEENLTFRDGEDYLKNESICRYLEKALYYFRLAAHQDKQDRICRYNLAAALILKQKYAAAQAVCNTVLETYSQDVNALNNLAVALRYYGKEMDLDTEAKVMEILQRALQADPDNQDVCYNLNAFCGIQCKHRGAMEEHYKRPYAPIPLPPEGIRPGQVFAAISHDLDKSNISQYKIGGEWDEENENDETLMMDIQVLKTNNLRILAIDGTVEIVEQEIPPNRKIKNLLKKYGPPSKQLNHTHGTFYVYQEKGFSIKALDDLAISFIWFEKGF